MRYIDRNLPDKHLHWRKRAVRRPPISTYQNGSWGRSSFKREVEVSPQNPQAYKHGASLKNSKYESNVTYYIWLHQFSRKAAVVQQSALGSRPSSLLYSQSPSHSNSPKRPIKSKEVKGSPLRKAEHCAKGACSNPSFLPQETRPCNLFKHGQLKLGKSQNNCFQKELAVTVTPVAVQPVQRRHFLKDLQRLVL